MLCLRLARRLNVIRAAKGIVSVAVSIGRFLRCGVDSHANLRLGLVQIILGVDTGWCESVEEHDDGEEGEDNHRNTAEDGLAVTEISPLAAGFTSIALDRFVAELIVNHATQGDAVSKELQAGNLGAPNDHRGSHK